MSDYRDLQAAVHDSGLQWDELDAAVGLIPANAPDTDVAAMVGRVGLALIAELRALAVRLDYLASEVRR